LGVTARLVGNFSMGKKNRVMPKRDFPKRKVNPVITENLVFRKGLGGREKNDGGEERYMPALGKKKVGRVSVGRRGLYRVKNV